MALEDEILSWQEFAKALDTQDREAFERLIDASGNYCMAVSNAIGPVVFEAMAMSILLFKQKKLDKVEKKLAALRKKESARQVTSTLNL